MSLLNVDHKHHNQSGLVLDSPSSAPGGGVAGGGGFFRNSASSFHATSRDNSPNHPHSTHPYLLAPKLSVCFSGQLPDGVLNVRTSFQSRPSLIALGSKANSVTKFPVFVQTYSSNQTDPDDADSFLGDRKDSTIIIASGPEESSPQRSFDFCQVAVLLSELQLLAGILAVTFAISMHTSPSIERYYTPHWAGVPLFVAGLMGMGIKCRDWKADCSQLMMQVIKSAFSITVATAGAVSLTAAIFSITFLNTLMDLRDPIVQSIDFDQPVNTSTINNNNNNYTSPMAEHNSKYHLKCVFQQSNEQRSSNSSFQEFYVTNMQTPTDCENFLFNVKNYSFMQCVILLIGSIVSIIIITNNYFHAIKGKVKQLKENRVSLSFSNSESKHLDKIRDFQNRTTTGLNYHSDYPAISAPDLSEDNNQMDEHNFQNSSPTSSRAMMYQLPRFRNSKDGNNVLPGVIIEANDD